MFHLMYPSNRRHTMPDLKLLSIFNFIFLLLHPSFSAAPSAKPGCLDRCGNLLIPYPFGVGSGCSLDPSFDIACNATTDPPKPYLSIINKEVAEINQTYIRVKYPYRISACYDSTNGAAAPNEASMIVNLSATPYTLSYTNRLTAVGCDDAVLQSNGRSVSGNSGSGGCSSICAEQDDLGRVGYCLFNASLGNACCQAEITGGTTLLGAQLLDLSGKLQRKRLFPCSYAFIQETIDTNETLFSYPLTYLQNSTAMQNDNWKSTSKPPVVRLDWKIGAENCSQAKSNPDTYACQDKNSVCSDSVDVVGKGYLCSCNQGYEGNPYLPGGCQTILYSSSDAKLGCSDQCGKLAVQFPFGMGPDCYLSQSFEVTCDTTVNPPRAYLQILNAEITRLSKSSVWIKYPYLASTCYHFSNNQIGITKTESQSLVIDLSTTQYSLSDENRITAIGCDDMVVAVIGKDKPTSIRSSCAAICSNRRINSGSYAQCPYVTTVYSPGDGCCRAPIPRGTTYLEANLTDLSGRWPRTNFSCSYAFVEYINIEEFYFITLSFLNRPLSSGFQPEVSLPETYWGPNKLSLDWRVGDVNCKEARRNLTNFACKNNTDCVDFDANVQGYLCNCSEGFQGNPYLSPSCQDIDECVSNRTNPCDSNSICINIPGSVYCSCPRGYYGDGRKNSIGCIQQPESKTKMIILTGLSSGLGFLLIPLMCFWLYNLLKKRERKMIREKFFKRNGGLLLQQQTNEGGLGTTKIFPSKELELATDYFNESRILGQGGQGTVYKGMLSDGKIVAIKKSKLVEENQLEQFINEVVILSQINHRNVVKLIGCCLETEVPLLVYEFMPNGTLFELIHDPNNEFPFSWSMRLKSAADIAGALAYLHYASSVPIYHRDIKSSNILLDEKYIVKVSDFGTSRSVSIDQTHLTTMVKGTFGYLDPEYFQSSQFTEKSDVYSFGVVLVELLTGLRPIAVEKSEEERGLATRFLTCMEENYLNTILDPQVSEQGIKEEVFLLALLAQRCLNMKGKLRPTMKEVANELERLLRLSQLPAQAKDEAEDVITFENVPFTISDLEYTWTGSYKNAGASSSSDMHPLIFPTY